MDWNVPTELTPQEKRLIERMRRKSRFYVFLREIRGELFDEAFQAELIAAYRWWHSESWRRSISIAASSLTRRSPSSTAAESRSSLVHGGTRPHRVATASATSTSILVDDGSRVLRAEWPASLASSVWPSLASSAVAVASERAAPTAPRGARCESMNRSHCCGASPSEVVPREDARACALASPSSTDSRASVGCRPDAPATRAPVRTASTSAVTPRSPTSSRSTPHSRRPCSTQPRWLRDFSGSPL